MSHVTLTVVSSYVQPRQSLTYTTLVQDLLVSVPLLLKLLREQVVWELGVGDITRHKDKGGTDCGEGICAKFFEIASYFHFVDIAEVNV